MKSGRRATTAALLALFVSTTLSAGARAAAVLSDGPGGITCQYYVSSARLPWQRAGGDWTDAEGKAYGDKPFASAQVGTRSTGRAIEWDVTALAQGWKADAPGNPAPTGSVLLREDRSQSRRAGIVNLRSRQHPDAASQPVLEVQWEDGQVDKLQASSDTFFACPTHKSAGSGKQLKVGGGHAAMLVFPWQPKGRSLRKATLQLTADHVYGAGLTIGAFQPHLPGGHIADPSRAKAGLAAQFRADDGIEKHPDVLFADRFEAGRRDGAAWSGKRMADANTVDEDVTERFEPLQGRALKVTIESGANDGLNAHYRFAKHARGGEPEEAFFRYYLRFGEHWDPHLDGGKMPGFSGTYGRGGWGQRRADGSNGWSARGAFFEFDSRGQAEAAALRGIGSYVYHAGRGGDSGAVWGWGQGPSGLLLKNRWYSVEQQVKLNTPGREDGEMRAWIDGELVFERTGLRFRDVPELKIESLWMNVYHGGTAKAPRDYSLFIDNLVIARRYIGPAAGLGPGRRQ